MFHQFVIHTVTTENYRTEVGNYHKSSGHHTDKVGEKVARIYTFSQIKIQQDAHVVDIRLT